MIPSSHQLATLHHISLQLQVLYFKHISLEPQLPHSTFGLIIILDRSVQTKTLVPSYYTVTGQVGTPELPGCPLKGN